MQLRIQDSAVSSHWAETGQLLKPRDGLMFGIGLCLLAYVRRKFRYIRYIPQNVSERLKYLYTGGSHASSALLENIYVVILSSNPPLTSISYRMESSGLAFFTRLISLSYCIRPAMIIARVGQ